MTPSTVILAIESSCDETGLALVSYKKNEAPKLLAHCVHTQIAMHQPYGGVVPELASRDHIQRVIPLTECVLNEAKLKLADIDVVAYTKGPGLAGALLVGAGFACSLAYGLQKPTIGIHHLEGHLLSPFLSKSPPSFPFLALLVSGGHTQLFHVKTIGNYESLGESIDDAAGEAFDKSAKLMGIAYPGGAMLSKLAQNGNPDAFSLPRPLLHATNLDFSFSGLKTAVRTQLQKLLKSHNLPSSLVGDTSEFEQLPTHVQHDLAASTQAAIVDVLTKKTLAALAQTGLTQLVVAGGVGANTLLRKQLTQACTQKNIQVHYPELEFCTDNGAMIAYCAALRLQAGVSVGEFNYDFSVNPRWPL